MIGSVYELYENANFTVTEAVSISFSVGLIHRQSRSGSNGVGAISVHRLAKALARYRERIEMALRTSGFLLKVMVCYLCVKSG